MSEILTDGKKPRTIFVLGGARSGKSSFAQETAEKLSTKRVFVATAEAHDNEMHERIRHHQKTRGEGWKTVEAPLDLATVIKQEASFEKVLVIDCLTLWLSNLMGAGRNDFPSEFSQLCEAIKNTNGSLVIVSNEIGFGIVPDNPLVREFRDEQGRLNQRVASVCDVAVFVVAGLPMFLKGNKID